MTNPDKPRWQYRFDNFKRAYTLLREAIETSEERPLTQLEKEGVIQRFEYSMELAWKTRKDYLEAQNVVLEQITPRSVIKAAVAAKLVGDGETWMEALDARNKMSHTYDFKQFEAVITEIKTGIWKRWIACILTFYPKRWVQKMRDPDPDKAHGLTPKQVKLIKAILRPYADQIERVDLFGSRATGNYRPQSDIDLVIHGPITEKTVDRLWTLFEESSLPLKVDVKAYNQLTYEPLKAHMDQSSVVFLEQSELLNFYKA